MVGGGGGGANEERERAQISHKHTAEERAGEAGCGGEGGEVTRRSSVFGRLLMRTDLTR